MELVGGILKVLDKGAAEPEAVRFHVPAEDGGWSQVTWGEVLDRSRSLALWLDEQGVGPDTKVSVFANTRTEWAYCTLAIEACRGVFVPVYFSNTADQTHFVVDHSDATVLFTEMALLPKLFERWRDYAKVRSVVVWDLDPGQLEQALMSYDERTDKRLGLAEVNVKLLSLEQAMHSGRELLASRPRRVEEMVGGRGLDDLAAIIYTSGTTGTPKGVMLSNRNLAASAISWHQVLEHAFPDVGDRRDILWLPVSHMSGWGILGQGTTYEYETWLSDPYRLLEILPEVRPTMLLSVPAYWEKMYAMSLAASSDPAEQHAALRQLTGGALRFCLSGGAGLKREIKEHFHAAGIQIIEGYGLTECAPNLTMNRLDDFDFSSIGKPMPGVELKLADDGEIIVKGDNVFAGYYKNREETEAVFDEEGWFHTGDLGAWTDAGFMTFSGRKKEIIATSGGKKIGPAGIEARFAGNPFIEHLVVYGNEHKYLVGLVTLAEPVLAAWAAQQGIEGTFAELSARPEIQAIVQRAVGAVNAELASYETIKRYEILDQPLSVEAGHVTPSLKLRRKRVWEDFEDRFEALYQ